MNIYDRGTSILLGWLKGCSVFWRAYSKSNKLNLNGTDSEKDLGLRKESVYNPS